MGFTLLFLIVDIIGNIDKFIDSPLSQKEIFQYSTLSIPSFISIALPMTTLLTCIFTIGQLQKNHELTAMKASGVSLYRIAMPMILCSILISGISFFFEDQIVTIGNQKRRSIEKEYFIKSRNKSYSTKKQDIFLRKSDDFHIAIDRYTPKTQKASGVVIHFMNEGRLIKRIDASTMAWLNKENKWKEISKTQNFSKASRLIALAAFMLPFTHTFFGIAFSQLLNGFGRGLINAVLITLSVLVVAPNKRATAMGIYQALYAIGMLSGPIIAGLVADWSGINTVFFLCTFISLAGIAFTHLTKMPKVE